MFVVGYRHNRPDRLHRVEFAATYADDFSYVGSRGTAVLPPEDDATSLEARYEYRRFPFRDVGLRGFDVGVGVEAILDRTVLSRSFAPAIVYHRCADPRWRRCRGRRSVAALVGGAVRGRVDQCRVAGPRRTESHRRLAGAQRASRSRLDHRSRRDRFDSCRRPPVTGRRVPAERRGTARNPPGMGHRAQSSHRGRGICAVRRERPLRR